MRSLKLYTIYSMHCLLDDVSMSAEYFCKHCNKPCPTSNNYCDFNCHIADCESNGYTRVTPNNLPIKCITGDGLLLECEHGDHPTYIKPVTVTVFGYRYNININSEEIGPEYSDSEIHALIYNDDMCAVTMYEGCYFFWIESKLKYTSVGFEHYKKYDATLIM